MTRFLSALLIALVLVLVLGKTTHIVVEPGTQSAGAARDAHCDGVTPSEATYLLNRMSLAAAIHRDYAAKPELTNASTGDVDWNAQWASDYDRMIAMFARLLRGCV